jgi:hypothetical protein
LILSISLDLPFKYDIIKYCIAASIEIHTNKFRVASLRGERGRIAKNTGIKRGKEYE